MRISVWDDDTQSAIYWKKAIEEVVPINGVNIEAHDEDIINDELNLLHERRKAYIKGSEDRGPAKPRIAIRRNQPTSRGQ